MMRRPYTPHPWQTAMARHIVQTPRCSVWASMGLGKTAATLSALDFLYQIGEETQPSLVLAPLRVAQTVWPEEAAKWDGFRHIEVSPVIGNPKERSAALKNTNASLFTLNYENIPWLIETLDGKSWPFGTLIADESTRLKGFRLAHSARRVRPLVQVAHTHIRRWINLTGTPAPNGLIDLWGQQWFVDKGHRLGATFTRFKEYWFDKAGYGGYGIKPKPHAQRQIEGRLKDVCLSLAARDWFDLTKPIRNVISVELPPKARARYLEMEKGLFTQIQEHGVLAANMAVRTIKCLQLANGAAYVEPDEAPAGEEDKARWVPVHDAKIEALREIVEEAAGAPILVAYHFRSDLARLQQAFPQGRVLDKNPQTIDDWNAGHIPILFAHPQSAGHGLNLQDGGNILVFFAHWWSLETYQQIIERIGPVRQRQAGHRRPVFVHYIVAKNTIDELVMKRRETRREVQDLLIEAMKERC